LSLFCRPGAISAFEPADFLAANGQTGSPVNVHRAEHRREHIDEIETALKS
jgi:hypothetical protein